jgi:hypothetical protein
MKTIFLATLLLTGCSSISPEQGRERILNIGFQHIDRVFAPQAVTPPATIQKGVYYK